MQVDSNKTAVVVFGHGSKKEQANTFLLDLVRRVDRRAPDLEVRPAFFSLAEPTISEQIAALASEGFDRILLVPYFLYDGIHISVDLPDQLACCRERFPQVRLEVMPTLQGEPALEDCLVDRLLSLQPPRRDLPQTGREIESLSHAVIDDRLTRKGLGDPEYQVVRRIIHATADFSFADSVRISEGAVWRGVAALQEDRPVLCDAKMVWAGITQTDGDVVCVIRQPAVAERARRDGTTRSVAAMRHLADRMHGAVVAIGNAPTALFEVLRLAREEGVEPAVVVGLPVGFVGARE
ncbi:MAG: precorrin-8X methylmutase, partial [Planctomycetota bacterium]